MKTALYAISLAMIFAGVFLSSRQVAKMTDQTAMTISAAVVERSVAQTADSTAVRHPHLWECQQGTVLVKHWGSLTEERRGQALQSQLEESLRERGFWPSRKNHPADGWMVEFIPLVGGESRAMIAGRTDSDWRVMVYPDNALVGAVLDYILPK